MKKFLLAAGLFAMLGTTACKNSESEQKAQTTTVADTSKQITATASADGKEVAIANLVSTSDTATNIGSAKFYKLADGMVKMDLEINLKSRADSNVAVHFHEHGSCSNKGEDAHGHWNPTHESHGKWGEGAFHAGDIGNIKLDANGHGTISITSDRWNTDSTTYAQYIIGKSIIVHGGTDDYKTQPTGNSGPRVGCGVIMKL